jgi:unsaturated chondroitin disaccharide hydrolase
MLACFEKALAFAEEQVRRTVSRDDGRFPLFTQSGEWRLQAEGQRDRLAACHLATMWVLHEARGESFWRECAERHTRKSEQLWGPDCAPGIGFVAWFGGHRRWYETSLREHLPEPMIHDYLVKRGRELGGTFQRGGYLGSTGAPGTLSVESLLEVPLILFAAAETQDQDLSDLAARHCAAVRKCLVRGDGSVAEQAIMDEQTGHCHHWATRSGLRPDSCWSCGLAWAVLGFATAGKMMEFEPWLETARRSANYLMERLSGDPVPPWDFDAPPELAGTHDSGAAAVTVVALLALADAEQRVGPEQARYRRLLQDAALRILDALCQPEYLAVGDPQWEGILKHAVGSVPAGWAVDESVIWADAFLVEGLHRGIQLLKGRA